MKILLFGDIHFNSKNQVYSKFLDETMGFLFQTASRLNPDLIINLGDLFHTMNVLDIRDVVKMHRTMHLMSSSLSGKMWTLKGNHDIADREEGIAITEITESPSNRIFMHPQVITLPFGDVLILPYARDQESLVGNISRVDFPKIRAVFGHIDWYGCKLTPSFVTDFGLKPEEFLSKLAPGARIFNGHYHHPQDLGRFHLVGSPLHCDFNDVLGTIERGFTFWDTDTDKVERIVNPSTYYCLTLAFSTEEEAYKASKDLEPMKDRIRARISVPSKIVEVTSKAFDGFLWKSVIPADSTVASIFSGTGLKVCSSPAEVVQRGVEAAPDGLDRGALQKIGEGIFSKA